MLSVQQMIEQAYYAVYYYNQFDTTSLTKRRFKHLENKLTVGWYHLVAADEYVTRYLQKVTTR